MSTIYYQRINEDIEYQFDRAPKRLEVAYGWGRPADERNFRQWISNFSDLYTELVELQDNREVNPETEYAALDACTDILALTYICPDDYIKYIVRIRLMLLPEADWSDWPYDVKGLEESDDEGELMFEMEI